MYKTELLSTVPGLSFVRAKYICDTVPRTGPIMEKEPCCE